MLIDAIYKIPATKHIFFIMSSLQEFSTSQKLSLENKRRTECFEHILQSIDRMPPKAIPQWTLKIVCRNDFLSVLQHNMPKELVSSNQSFHNPEYLELLAINLLKTPENSCDFAFNTPKVLSAIPEEDIIEVYI